jgi:predicted DNA-binding transcriptional regulator AlpA
MDSATSDPDFLTIEDTCAIIGGSRPISHATFYRGVKAGRFPKPERISAGLVRVRRAALLEALNRGAE